MGNRRPSGACADRTYPAIGATAVSPGMTARLVVDAAGHARRRGRLEQPAAWPPGVVRGTAGAGRLIVLWEGRTTRGVLFTLADTALGLAANPPGEPTWAGTGFQLQLFRPVGVGDVVAAEAEEVNRSRQLLAYRSTLRCGERLIGTLDAQLLRAVAAG